MTIFEKLGQWMFEEIRAKICCFRGFDCEKCPDFISKYCDDDCDVCPAVIYRMSKRHHRPCNTMDIEEILGRLGKGGEDCYKCPIFISEHCKTEETEEGEEDNDES